MAKFVNDSNMDALLDRIRDNTAKVTINSGQPGTFAEAVTAFSTANSNTMLGQQTITATAWSTAVNGDTSGRKITFQQLTGTTIENVSTAGSATTADHIAIVTSTTASELLLVTTISNSQTVSTGNTATINSFDHEVRDPT